MYERFEFQDSRGEAVRATVSGPYGSGSFTPGQSITELPQKWMARFSRNGRPGEVHVELHSSDVTAAELRELLEREPEWLHEWGEDR